MIQKHLRTLGDRALPRFVTPVLLALCVCLPMLLFHLRLEKPFMAWDDFPFVRDSLNWERTRASLWSPFASHLCPPFRLLTWGLVTLAGPLSSVPESLRWSSIIAHVLVSLALFTLVSRETHSPAAALTTVLLAGLSTVHPGVGIGGQHWGSALMFAMAFTLIVLLSIQSWGRTGNRASVVLSGMAAAIAPSWHAAGLIAGLVGSVYAWLSCPSNLSGRRRVLLASVPFVGTLVFVLIALSLSANDIFDSGNFGKRSIFQAFRPDRGILLTALLIPEHVVAMIGVRQPLHIVHAIGLFAVIVLVSAFWLRSCTYRSLAICGLSLMIGSYLFVYSFRGYMDINLARKAAWYLYFPNVGLSLFIGAGLPRRLRPLEIRIAIESTTAQIDHLKDLMKLTSNDCSAGLERLELRDADFRTPQVQDSLHQSLKRSEQRLWTLQHLWNRWREQNRSSTLGDESDKPLKWGEFTALMVVALMLFVFNKSRADLQSELNSGNQLALLSQLQQIEEISRRWEIDAATVHNAIGPFDVSGYDGLSLIELPASGRAWDPEDVRQRISLVLESGSIEDFAQSSQSGDDRVESSTDNSNLD